MKYAKYLLVSINVFEKNLINESNYKNIKKKWK